MVSSSMNNGLFSAITKTISVLAESGPDHEKIGTLRADTAHHLRMYYSKLQMSKAYELLAKHGEPEEADSHTTKAGLAMRQASDHHSQAAAYHKELCAQGGNVHSIHQGEDFTSFKREAREHVGYKE